ncbi:GNAT family N-acetyltransferase [Pseudoalteromonas citrea]|uniref:GNAT family N-acetyltransferase n=1 Tax=Pseudoalteromonas citrea TaxID=43655 RepID=A0A5S3XQ75_9GAMM|nr:GNAT family protein [Pseudoalteromonas citrea]TMP39198.1 GNAT family N-acetyltransferase [Pseudoalteromonas citrea]TMP57137.1 GNAT family N-acetyltransferase [Pseudoalteromonas citrea]
MKICTSRLTIRPMTMADLQASFAHRSCPQTSRYISDQITLAQAKQRLAENCQPWLGEENQRLALAITLNGLNELIGEVMFKYTNKTSLVGEIGYRLKKEVIGKGYAFEAVNAFIAQLFSQLEVMKIVAVCAVDNTPSWRLMEKLQMQREGVFKSHFLIGGERLDAYSYGICRP